MAQTRTGSASGAIHEQPAKADDAVLRSFVSSWFDHTVVDAFCPRKIWDGLQRLQKRVAPGQSFRWRMNSLKVEQCEY